MYTKRYSEECKRDAVELVRLSSDQPIRTTAALPLLAARTYPTLTESARDLGIHQSTLVIQINRLEADLGLPLFERAERHDGETK
ncbi:LysR family transcriptional regulator [Streptomyces sp. NPDC051658]|uniref:LysR family transcriptional regulator n=1 Tax=Streptomyces sp. NPDC051658 TaxID=3365667 RepID=UPI0037A54281